MRIIRWSSAQNAPVLPRVDHPEEEAGYALLALVARARLAGAGHSDEADPVESNI